MRRLLFWTLLTNLLVPVPGWSQPRNYLSGRTKGVFWQHAHHPETLHDINKNTIQQQLTVLDKQLCYLSEVDPPTYSRLQTELQQYLHLLADANPDFGNQTVYQSVLLKLTQLGKSVNQKLDAGMSYAYASTHSGPDSLVPGSRVELLPYALVFKRPDYRSNLAYVVSLTQPVTILKNTPGNYCLIHCGGHKGYLNKGMIVRLLQPGE